MIFPCRGSDLDVVVFGLEAAKEEKREDVIPEFLLLAK